MRFIVLALALALGVQAASEPVVQPYVDMIETRNKLKTHVLYAPYVDTDLQNRWWDFGGDAIINTNKHVRLTQDKQSQSGWIWSRMPLTVTNWQVEFEFKVEGKSNTIGDGFAMWLTRDRATPGPVFGNQDFFTGLGIFFDTYPNTRSHGYSFPRITAMLGDGQKKYDHERDNEAHELAACSMNFKDKKVATKARLTYIKGKGLQLEVHFDEWDEWKTCFQVEAALPDAPFIGFTGMTGDLSENNDIVAISTYSTLLLPQFRAQPQVAAPGKSANNYGASSRKPYRQPSSGGASWFLFLLKMIAVVAFIAFVYAALRTYSAQQNKRPAYY